MIRVSLTSAAKKTIEDQMAALSHAQPVVFVHPEPVDATYVRTPEGDVRFEIRSFGRWFVGVGRGSGARNPKCLVQVGAITVCFLEMPKVPPAQLLIGCRKGQLYGKSTA